MLTQLVNRENGQSPKRGARLKLLKLKLQRCCLDQTRAAHARSSPPRSFAGSRSSARRASDPGHGHGSDLYFVAYNNGQRPPAIGLPPGRTFDYTHASVGRPRRRSLSLTKFERQTARAGSQEGHNDFKFYRCNQFIGILLVARFLTSGLTLTLTLTITLTPTPTLTPTLIP